MQKIVLLLIALTIAPWAKTWEYAEAFDYYAWLEEDSLGSDRLTEDTLGIYFYAQNLHIDSMGVDKYDTILSVRNGADDAGDSVWISKYWMDDSLRESPVVMDADVDRDDFRPLTFDSLHTEYDLWPLLDERAENASERKSLFLLYRKDTSYYALCLLGKYLPGCVGDLYLSCQFQDDGTTNFEKIPDVEGIDFQEQCPAFLPKASRRPPAVGLQDGVPYRVNGTRSRGGASSVVIRNGLPKLELRK
ncbi:MAG: hypothetical protein WCR04_09665 [Fibrobacteraceae bacterium]